MCHFKNIMLACRFILTVTTVRPYHLIHVLKKQTDFCVCVITVQAVS